MSSVFDRFREDLPPGYTIERELASGGMGTVFLGRDLALDRRVAIKILRPELSTAVAIERFQREAQYLAGLNHPNIVPVHFTGRAGGLVYYVMDYVDGETLDSRLSRGPLSVKEVIKLGQDLLSGLAAAHDRKITHRDIKPANVFLVGGRAILGDFGIAHSADAPAEALTRTGQIIGTVAYMAPEQLSGSPVTPQTDLYAVGLVLYQACTGRRWEYLASPQQGSWEDVPPVLLPALQTALEPRPQDRWESARSFAQALKQGDRSRLNRLAPVFPLAALATFGLFLWLRPHGSTQTSNVALYPFEVAGISDTAFGTQLARLTASYLEALPGITVAPVRTTFRTWRSSDLPTGERLARLTASLDGAQYGVWGVIRPTQGGIEVQLQAVDARGQPVLQAVVQGDPADRVGLGDALALQIVRKVFPRSEHLYRSAGAFAGVSPRAVTEFLFGEDASERDAWLTAERHYLAALAIDSTFVLAAWRLANARRWMPLRATPPLPSGFLDLYRAHANGMSPIDRLLVDAQFAPTTDERFALYEQALQRAPHDAYPALYYGDELFHRGALAGRPGEAAIAMLQRAVELDSSLAPAYEHLAWALIRAGRRQQARRSLDALARLAGSPEESEIYLPALLEIAFAMRFTPEAAVKQKTELGSPSVLGLAARGALSFDMPAIQAALGAQLAALPAAAPALHGSGEVAQGVALMAMGRPADALPHLDAAARMLPAQGEARLQAAEWRVVPSVIGLPGVPPLELQRGRRELMLLAQDSAFRNRAAWLLAVDGLKQRDSAAAAEWVHQLISHSDSNNPFRLHLAALQQSFNGNFRDALQTSRAALVYDSAGRAGDPFFRALLHYQRGEWHAALGQTQATDADWLWYENVDAVGWPSTVAQACEVDWAFGTYARWSRARLADSTSGHAASCHRMAEVATLWSNAEPAYAPLLSVANEVSKGCPQ